MKNLYLKAADIDFKLEDLVDKPCTNRILMCTPEHFDVTEAINRFMVTQKGEEEVINRVDRDLAQKQWNYIRDLYLSLGYEVEYVSGPYGMEDAVFSANQSFPFLNLETGAKEVVMSIMRKEKRKKKWLISKLGIKTKATKSTISKIAPSKQTAMRSGSRAKLDHLGLRQHNAPPHRSGGAKTAGADHEYPGDWYSPYQRGLLPSQHNAVLGQRRHLSGLPARCG